MPSTQLLLIRSILAFTIALILILIVAPKVWMISSAEWDDQGGHILVIIESTGSAVDYEVRVKSKIDSETNSLNFTFYTMSNQKKSDTSPRPKTNMSLYFLGENISDYVTCGKDGQGTLDTINSEDMSTGALRAYNSDLISNVVSATNYRLATDPQSDSTPSSKNQVSTDLAAASPAGIEILKYDAGSIVGWFSDEKPHTKFSENKDGIVFVDECTIDSKLIWKSSTANEPTQSSHTTLFMPEFDLVPLEETTDHQENLNVSLWISRMNALELTLSYPEPTEIASQGWYFQYKGSWVGQKGGERSWIYTLPPTLLFSNRDERRIEQAWLFYGGLFLAFSIVINSPRIQRFDQYFLQEGN